LTLETSKNLGGIGAILMLVGVIPVLSFLWVVAFAGLVLVMIALKGFADYYKESGIFNNALYGIIAAIVGGVAAVVLILTSLVGFLGALGISVPSLTNWNSWGNWTTTLPNINYQNINLNAIMPFVAAILGSLLVLFVGVVIMAIFVRKSFGLMSSKTGKGLFATTGLIILIGAVLTIILIGVLLIWVALIPLAAAFFSVEPKQTQPVAAASNRMPS
jgi:uncharacterized membrane protein